MRNTVVILTTIMFLIDGCNSKSKIDNSNAYLGDRKEVDSLYKADAKADLPENRERFAITADTLVGYEVYIDGHVGDLFIGSGTIYVCPINLYTDPYATVPIKFLFVPNDKNQ